MPEDLSPKVEVQTSPADLAKALASAAQSVPGMLRLEPSMKNSLAKLAARRASKMGMTASAVVDGVTVISRNGVDTVRCDIATDMTYSALTVAAEVQQRARSVLTEHGREVGAVDVIVLSVEVAPTS